MITSKTSAQQIGGGGNQLSASAAGQSQSSSAEWHALSLLLQDKKGQCILDSLQECTQTLKSTKAETWQRRAKSLEKIRSVFLDVAEHIENEGRIVQIAKKSYPSLFTMREDEATVDNSKKEMLFGIMSWIQRILQSFLILQLQDTRTSIVRETCAIITWMSCEFPEEFSTQISATDNLLGGGNGVRYFASDAIPKLISSGNKLLADLGHQTIRIILENSPPIETVEHHLIPFVNSKASSMRLKISQYFEILLQKAIKSQRITSINARKRTQQLLPAWRASKQIEQNYEIFEYFLLKTIIDGDHDVRNQARYCFILYKELMPCRSSALLLYGVSSPPVLKNILKELDLDIEQIKDDYEQNHLQHQRRDGQSLEDQIVSLKKTYNKASTPEQFQSIQKRGDVSEKKKDVDSVSANLLVTIEQVDLNDNKSISKTLRFMDSKQKIKANLGAQQNYGRKSMEKSTLKQWNNQTLVPQPSTGTLDKKLVKDGLDHSSVTKSVKKSYWTKASSPLQFKTISERTRSPYKIARVAESSPDRLLTIMKKYSLNQNEKSASPTIPRQHRFPQKQQESKLNQSFDISGRLSKSFKKSMIAPNFEPKTKTTARSIEKKSQLEQVPEEAGFSSLFDQYKTSVSPSRRKLESNYDSTLRLGNQTVHKLNKIAEKPISGPPTKSNQNKTDRAKTDNITHELSKSIVDRPKSGNPFKNDMQNKKMKLNQIQEERNSSGGGSDNRCQDGETPGGGQESRCQDGISPYKKMNIKSKVHAPTIASKQKHHIRMRTEFDLNKYTKTLSAIIDEKKQSLQQNKSKNHFRTYLKSNNMNFEDRLSKKTKIKINQVKDSLYNKTLNRASSSYILNTEGSDATSSFKVDYQMYERSNDKPKSRISTVSNKTIAQHVNTYNPTNHSIKKESSDLYFKQTKQKNLLQQQAVLMRKKSITLSRQLANSRRQESHTKSDYFEMVKPTVSSVNQNKYENTNSRQQLLQKSSRLLTQTSRPELPAAVDDYQTLSPLRTKSVNNLSCTNLTGAQSKQKHNFTLHTDQSCEVLQQQNDIVSSIKQKRRAFKRSNVLSTTQTTKSIDVKTAQTTKSIDVKTKVQGKNPSIKSRSNTKTPVLANKAVSNTTTVKKDLAKLENTRNYEQLTKSFNQKSKGLQTAKAMGVSQFSNSFINLEHSKIIDIPPTAAPKEVINVPKKSTSMVKCQTQSSVLEQTIEPETSKSFISKGTINTSMKKQRPVRRTKVSRKQEQKPQVLNFKSCTGRQENIQQKAREKFNQFVQLNLDQSKLSLQQITQDILSDSSHRISDIQIVIDEQMAPQPIKKQPEPMKGPILMEVKNAQKDPSKDDSNLQKQNTRNSSNDKSVIKNTNTQPYESSPEPLTLAPEPIISFYVTNKEVNEPNIIKEYQPPMHYSSQTANDKKLMLTKHTMSTQTAHEIKQKNAEQLYQITQQTPSRCTDQVQSNKGNAYTPSRDSLISKTQDQSNQSISPQQFEVIQESVADTERQDFDAVITDEQIPAQNNAVNLPRQQEPKDDSPLPNDNPSNDQTNQTMAVDNLQSFSVDSSFNQASALKQRDEAFDNFLQPLLNNEQIKNGDGKPQPRDPLVQDQSRQAVRAGLRTSTSLHSSSNASKNQPATRNEQALLWKLMAQQNDNRSSVCSSHITKSVENSAGKKRQ